MSSNLTAGTTPPVVSQQLPSGRPRAPEPRNRLMRACAALAESSSFNLAIVGVILANAVLLGLGTYPAVTQAAGGVIRGLEAVFLSVFVVELAIRMIAHGRRPQDFFRDGWNVFDFLVVAAAFVPGLAANSTLLRLARLARVMRVVRFFPALRVILIGVARSLPGLGGFLVLSVLTLYLYGMVGWLMFGASHPEEWGTIGNAVLTLFVLLSLESLPDSMAMAVDAGPWAVLYFISYVLVASYLLINILIGVVINSMEESRRVETAEQLEAGFDADGDGVPDELDRAAVAQRIEDLQRAIQSLEAELRIRRD